mgnify:CR=1 FL=1
MRPAFYDDPKYKPDDGALTQEQMVNTLKPNINMIYSLPMASAETYGLISENIKKILFLDTYGESTHTAELIATNKILSAYGIKYILLETKKTLDVDTRDDEDIYKLYNLMHDNFEANGGIREHKWLNLYSPFRYMKLDFGNDGWHPGPLSHKKFGAHLAQCFFNLNQTTNTK